MQDLLKEVAKRYCLIAKLRSLYVSFVYAEIFVYARVPFFVYTEMSQDRVSDIS